MEIVWVGKLELVNEVDQHCIKAEPYQAVVKGGEV